MVLLLLQIKADLENLTNLIPRGGSDGSPFWYFFKVKCGSCGEMSDKFSAVTATEQLQMPRSRGVAHLVQKVSGSKFADIDLSEGEFAEYDEKASCPVGITDIEHKFVVAQ
eukprot:c18151_g1_i2 orf=266-598(+)